MLRDRREVCPDRDGKRFSSIAACSNDLQSHHDLLWVQSPQTSVQRVPFELPVNLHADPPPSSDMAGHKSRP